MKKKTVPVKKKITRKEVNKKETKFDEAQRESIEKWINKQRALYRKDALDEQTIKKLEALPNWQWKNRRRFDSYMNLVKNYADRHKNSKPPIDYLENGVNIYKWLYNQRKRYQSGSLDGYEINALESLPDWSWEMPQRTRVKFEDMLMIAHAYLSQT